LLLFEYIMYSKAILFIFSILLTNSCLAQVSKRNIEGVILDNELGHPVSGVLIIDSLNLITTLSDENGYFQLTISDSSSILLSHITYDLIRVPVEKFSLNEPDTFYLNPMIEQLDEIILRKLDYNQFKINVLTLERDSFETNVQLPGVRQYKGPINLQPGGDRQAGSKVTGAISHLINPKVRERKRVNRWMKKIKKRQEK